MRKKQGPPRYWVTWLAKLMSGDNMCRWAAWFKARYSYEKAENSTGFDIQNWTMLHTALLNRRADVLRGDGWKVTLEDENPVEIVGRTGVVVAGKMDLVALKGSKVLIEDMKTGKKRTSDHAQVGIYMMLYPDKSKEVWGNVVYGDDDIVKVNPIEPRCLGELMEALSKEPKKSPSARECKYCDIAECPDRHVPKNHFPLDTDIF